MQYQSMRVDLEMKQILTFILGSFNLMWWCVVRSFSSFFTNRCSLDEEKHVQLCDHLKLFLAGCIMTVWVI